MVSSHTEAHSELFFPVHETTTQTGPLMETSVMSIADQVGQMKDLVFRVYVANLCSLGSSWEKAIHELFRILSDKLAENPERTCVIMVMPNVGTRGDLYEESSIAKAQCDIKDRSWHFFEQATCEPEFGQLRVGTVSAQTNVNPRTWRASRAWTWLGGAWACTSPWTACTRQTVPATMSFSCW